MGQELDWLGGLRRYLAVTAGANLIWETAHLPLYTIWNEGTLQQKATAVLHCTAGDVLIALSTWAFAVTISGDPAWPAKFFRRVSVVVVLTGLMYTGFSEWLNTTLRRDWAYSDLMPMIPGLDLGLSPALQWIAIPVLALWAARRAIGTPSRLSP